MFAEDRAAVKVGVFVVLALIAVVLGITLGRGIQFEAAWQPVYVIFPQAPGLEVGDPVTVNGVKRGVVLDFRNISQGVLVKIGMDHLDDIMLDARPVLQMLEITGGRKVEIFPGHSDTPVRRGDTLKGKTGVDIPMMLAATYRFIDSTARVLSHLDQAVRRLNATILQPATLRQLQGTVENLQRLTMNLDRFFDEHQDQLQQTLQSTKHLVARLDTLLRQSPLDTLLGNLAKTSTQLPVLVQQLHRSLQRFDTTLSEIRPLLRQLQSDQTLVGRLLQDPQFNQQIDTVLQTLGQLLQQVQRYGINVNVRLGTRP